MLTPEASVERLFCELVAIPSVSGRERAVGEAIQAWLAARGVEASFDGAGAVNDSDAGNLIARVPGAPGAPTLLFVAHLDTVESGLEAISPVIGADGVIRSAAETILGADNKSAVAATMRLCAAAAAADRASAPEVIAAFTCREEAGRMGASLLDPATVAAVDCAFSVDGSSPVGTVITRALGQQVFTVVVRGRAAHAAADPDAGVSAIAVAAQAIAAMELGRLAGGGSASIAAIVGGAVVDRLGGAGATSGTGDPGGAPGGGAGAVRAALDATPTNSVPDLVMLRGEVRGYSEPAPGGCPGAHVRGARRHVSVA
jgi:tripeptide aminopeptidase